MTVLWVDLCTPVLHDSTMETQREQTVLPTWSHTKKGPQFSGWQVPEQQQQNMRACSHMKAVFSSFLSDCRWHLRSNALVPFSLSFISPQKKKKDREPSAPIARKAHSCCCCWPHRRDTFATCFPSLFPLPLIRNYLTPLFSLSLAKNFCSWSQMSKFVWREGRWEKKEEDAFFPFGEKK